MWAWGSGVFQCEDGWDTRQAYLEALGHDDGSGRTARDRITARFLADSTASVVTFWPALAAVQLETGHIDDDIRAEICQIIESGAATAAWQAAGATRPEIRRYTAALTELSVSLDQPPEPAKRPRALTTRKRIRAMMAPYWRRLDQPAQSAANELGRANLVGRPQPLDVDRLQWLLASLRRDQAWLVVAHKARILRWRIAFFDEVLSASRLRLGKAGLLDGVEAGVVPLVADQTLRQDLLLLERFGAEREASALFSATLWQIVGDDPKRLRPPGYPQSLRQAAREAVEGLCSAGPDHAARSEPSPREHRG